jgi:hypothetical protein
MKNGDRFTGEIKKLEFGQLHVKFSYSLGNAIFDWSKVEKIESPQGFVVETTDGSYHTGRLQKDAEGEERTGIDLTVKGRSGTVRLQRDQVVVMRQLEEQFYRNMTFKIDYGFGYTRDNDRTNSSLNGLAEHRNEHHWLGGSVDSQFTGQTGAASTNRHHVNTYYNRFLGSHNWFAGGLANFLSSSQQNLDLRTTMGGGMGKRVLVSNTNDLTIFGGAVWNNERFSQTAEGDSLSNSLEALASVNFSSFRFDSSELKATFVLLPSLTDSGRVRTAFDVSMYWDIISDLYLRTSFFHNFDSRPPGETAGNDFGVTTSFGWKF